MEAREARLLDKLKRYEKLKKEIKECRQDIEELLLTYDFNLDEISNDFPAIYDFKTKSKRAYTTFK